ncbi:SIR2 family NAD-dependent protein deacylase [Burkholderia vietnamiensis]|uniref:SIR2 family NAD-dependent protein deacylase n=1 Tax=Burkholderia vietnamiensis TaxID=60552 RepID=UPI001B96AFEC|nr:Sir2 family NAD-dependent protein deacetylase [Burkholderia vietnamiensis]MBR8034473.1 NAD-dependent deacetylase [Burkholderia vietnamiensis]
MQQEDFTGASAEAIARAAEWVRNADALLITAGAGMGVDSGLPDFRGDEGLWHAYPALGTLKRSFQSIANPDAFRADPQLAWGFYGHRLKCYREIDPHAGFAALRRWAARMRHGAFVYTSNVDGQFQKAGFAEGDILECHGSIHYLQCAKPCCRQVWPAAGFDPDIDERACRMIGDGPRCAHCGGLARPNILMFGDHAWLEDRTEHQMERMRRWKALAGRIVVVEIGAGMALPTVRRFSERHAPRLVRINTREPQTDPAKGVGIRGGALGTLLAIDAAL